MNTHIHTAGSTTLAATVAPEDVQCGDYVAVLNEICEVPSWMWCESAVLSDETVRIKTCATDGGWPLKVKAVCLPFVFAKTAHRQLQTIDLRRVQLVRLDKRYARTVWRELRRDDKRRLSDSPRDARSPGC